MAKYVGFKVGKVHDSHVISEYYCGGCGYPVTDHDSFCPECGGAFRKCDADADDNQLEAENAKLRELASRMAVHWLPNDVRMTSDEWRDRDERIRDELRKLGIEAPNV